MKQLFRLLILLLMLVLIPVISRPVLAVGAGKFTLSPNTSTTIKTTTGSTQYITVDLYFTATNATPFFAIISQLDFTETASDQVSYDSFSPDGVLTARSGLNVVQNDGNGKLDGDINGAIFLAVTSSSPINSTSGTQVKLGTLKFKVLNPGTFTLGLNYDPAKTYVLDASDEKFTLESSYSGATGTYSITAPTAPTAPTLPPSNISVTGLPACISARLLDTEKEAATVNWTSTSNGPFWVDVSTTSSFNTYYHKSVTTKSTDMTGLHLIDSFPFQPIEILPATPHYLRVTDESTSQTNENVRINIPACAPAPYTIGGNVFIDNSVPPNGIKDSPGDTPDDGNGVTIRLKKGSEVQGHAIHANSAGRYDFTNVLPLPSDSDTYTIEFTLPPGYTAYTYTPTTREISNTTPNKTSIDMALIPPPTPTVTDFSITPISITQGVPTQLTIRWNVTNANACNLLYNDGAHWRVPKDIDPGVGVLIGVTPGPNSTVFSFTSSTNIGYKMKIQCTNASGQPAESNEVTFNALPPPSFCAATTDYTTFYNAWHNMYIQNDNSDLRPDCIGDHVINILDLNKWRTMQP